MNRRDAHFGHRFHDTFGGSFHVIFHRSFVVNTGENSLPNHVVERFKRKVRINCADAVTNEQGVVMNFARLTGFENQTSPRPRAFANHVMVHRRDGEQCRNRRVFFIDAPVRQNNERLTGLERLGDLPANFVHSFLQTLNASGRREKNRNRRRLEIRQFTLLNFGEILIGEDGTFQFDVRATFRSRIQQIAFRSERGTGAGDDFFANGINRRIGDLREKLFEIIIEQLRFFR